MVARHMWLNYLEKKGLSHTKCFEGATSLTAMDFGYIFGYARAKDWLKRRHVAKKKTARKALQRAYSRRELYEGYYWLILHADPYNFSWDFINETGVSDVHPVPECIKAISP